MQAEVGFYKDVAVVAVNDMVDQVNARFGDSVNKSACVEGLKQFFESGVDLKCRSCGWRKPKSRHCTYRGCDTSDSDTCDEFRHLFVVEDK
jgi:hypothetical protein